MRRTGISVCRIDHDGVTVAVAAERVAGRVSLARRPHRSNHAGPDRRSAPSSSIANDRNSSPPTGAKSKVAMIAWPPLRIRRAHRHGSSSDPANPAHRASVGKACLHPTPSSTQAAFPSSGGPRHQIRPADTPQRSSHRVPFLVDPHEFSPHAVGFGVTVTGFVVASLPFDHQIAQPSVLVQEREFDLTAADPAEVE